MARDPTRNAKPIPVSDPTMSPSIPSSVNITFDNIMSELGNLMPFIVTRSSRRIASAALGRFDAGIALKNSAADWRIIVPRGEFILICCRLRATISLAAPRDRAG